MPQLTRLIDEYAQLPSVSDATVRTLRHRAACWRRIVGSAIPTADAITQFRITAAKSLSPRTVEDTIAAIVRIAKNAGLEVDTGRRLRVPAPQPDVPTTQSLGRLYANAHAASWPRLGGGSHRDHCLPAWCPISRSDWWRAWIVTAAVTGLRLGDLRRLRADMLGQWVTASKTSKRHPVPDVPCLTRHWAKLKSLGPLPSKQLRAGLREIADAADVPYVSPQGFRRYAVTAWIAADATAGRIVHGCGIGVLAHYLDYHRILSDATPRLVLPKEFLSAAERKKTASDEAELTRRWRLASLRDRRLILDVARRVG